MIIMNIKKIASLLGGNSRTEKVTCVRIETVIDRSDLIKAAESLKKKLLPKMIIAQ